MAAAPRAAEAAPRVEAVRLQKAVAAEIVVAAVAVTALAAVVRLRPAGLHLLLPAAVAELLAMPLPHHVAV